MTTLNVQFTDANETAIQNYFGVPQDPAVYPNLGTVETSDPRWKTFYDMLAALYLAACLPAPTTE